MRTYTLQYDMGLRFWVLTDTQGQTVATYLSRANALRDETIRGLVERGCILRVRNADGTYQPADSRATAANTRMPAATIPFKAAVAA